LAHPRSRNPEVPYFPNSTTGRKADIPWFICGKGVGEQDFLTFLTACTDVRLYFVELSPLPSCPFPWIFPSGSLLSLKVGPCTELGTFSLSALLSDRNWLNGLQHLTLETNPHNLEAYWAIALACRGTLCHLLWRLVVSPTSESCQPLLCLSTHF